MLRMALALASLVCLPALLLSAADLPDSNACLSCHDGSSAVDVRRQPGHSFHVLYEKARTARSFDLDLKPATAKSALGGTIAEDLLVNGYVECSSCHVGHETYTSNPFRLRTEQQRTLCLSCHVPR